MKWQAVIYIYPQAKQSTRFTVIKGNRKYAYTDTRKREYMNALRLYIMSHPPERKLQGALSLTTIFVFPYPKSFPKYKRTGMYPKITKPDLDNLLKPLKDSMKGIIYDDDAQIAEHKQVGKYYDEQARIEIIVEEIEKCQNG